jgi:hypothetical protein
LVRRDSDESWVIDHCDDILGELARRQHRFPWLVGDPGRDGRPRTLPVDAYYVEHRLVVEYRERQHDEAVPFFDRRQTVSGVDRGRQRALYDIRRDFEVPRHDLRLLVVRPRDLTADSRGRLRRVDADRQTLERLLHAAIDAT